MRENVMKNIYGYYSYYYIFNMQINETVNCIRVGIKLYSIEEKKMKKKTMKHVHIFVVAGFVVCVTLQSDQYS